MAGRKKNRRERKRRTEQSYNRECQIERTIVKGIKEMQNFRDGSWKDKKGIEIESSWNLNKAWINAQKYDKNTIKSHGN